MFKVTKIFRVIKIGGRTCLLRDIYSHQYSILKKLFSVRADWALKMCSATLKGHLLHTFAVVAATAAGADDDSNIER